MTSRLFDAMKSAGQSYGNIAIYKHKPALIDAQHRHRRYWVARLGSKRFSIKNQDHQKIRFGSTKSLATLITRD